MGEAAEELVVDEERYNIEAKYLKSLLSFVEEDLDPVMRVFLFNPGEKEFQALINSVVIYLNKLSRSQRIKHGFLVEISGELAKIASKIKKDDKQQIPVGEVVKVVNRINLEIANEALFTKASPRDRGDGGKKKGKRRPIRQGPSHD